MLQTILTLLLQEKKDMEISSTNLVIIAQETNLSLATLERVFIKKTKPHRKTAIALMKFIGATWDEVYEKASGFGSRVLIRRLELGITQGELGRKVGVGKCEIMAVETERRRLPENSKLRAKLMKVLNISQTQKDTEIKTRVLRNLDYLEVEIEGILAKLHHVREGLLEE